MASGERERLSAGDILGYNLRWTDADRETVRAVLDLVADRTDYAYRTQTYIALRPKGAPRVPAYIGKGSVGVDRTIELPADLASRAIPENHNEGRYLQIRLSTFSDKESGSRSAKGTDVQSATCPRCHMTLLPSGECPQDC